MNCNLIVTLTHTYKQQPLAVIHNMPGMDAEMTPAQMRALASCLTKAAEECEARPMGKRTFLAVKRGYALAVQA
jgi:hypothetical protein